MAKSRKNNILKSVEKTSSKVLPVVDKSLKKIGTTSKDVAKNSFPVVEKGVSAVYGTMATGFNLGIKGLDSVAKGMTKSKRTKRHKKGGKKTRRKRYRH